MNECTHCHVCQDHCDFLKKYHIDLGDQEKIKALSDHCFLCGNCARLCPQGIDGRERILEMRKQRAAEDGGKSVKKEYASLLNEKAPYRFRNDRHIAGGTVFFPGCNLPSFFPKTTKRLVEIFEKQGIGTLYDCCGKPVAETGLTETGEHLVQDLKERLRKAHVEEIIVACPNCYYFLKDSLPMRVTHVYQKLADLGIGEKIPGGIPVFLPCPDRDSKEIFQSITSFFQQDCQPLANVPCCGLGGSAYREEPELAKVFARQIQEQGGKTIYTYCASCTGQLKRNGISDVRFILAWVLGTDEEPDTKKSYLNRACTRFI